MELNHTIRIDFRVWQELQKRRESEAMTENDVLRQALGLPPLQGQRAPSSPPAPSPLPNGKKLLKVIFPDGKEICDRRVVDTFIRVIEKVGPERVRRLQIQMGGGFLVAERPGKRPGQWKLLSGGLCVNTNSATNTKRDQLERISGGLGNCFRVEVV